MFKKLAIVDIIIILIIIQFLEYFSLKLITTDSFFKFTATRIVGILLASFLLIGPLFKNAGRLIGFDFKVLFLCVSIGLSSVMAYLYWDQTFAMSLNGYGSFFIFLLYFVFIGLNLSSHRIIRIFEILFYLSLIVFAINVITLPDSLFSYRNEERRNGVTIWFFGHGFTFLGAFHFLNKYFKTKKLYHFALFAAGAFCLFGLTQSRMNLLALAAGFVVVLLGSELKWRYLITVLLIVVGLIVYSSSGIFSGVKEASAEQGEHYKEDIRVLAHRYFLTELQGGTPTMLFGNGFPSPKSHLGLKTMDANEMGFWTADVGLTGVFSYFGLLGVLAWLVLFFSVFTIQKTEHSATVKAYFLTLLTTAFTGYSMFDPGYMPATVLALYLLRTQILMPENDFATS